VNVSHGMVNKELSRRTGETFWVGRRRGTCGNGGLEGGSKGQAEGLPENSTGTNRSEKTVGEDKKSKQGKNRVNGYNQKDWGERTFKKRVGRGKENVIS